MSLAAEEVYGQNADSFAGTRNDVHDEFARESDHSQYLHITEAHPLVPPTMDALTSLADLKAQKG